MNDTPILVVENLCKSFNFNNGTKLDVLKDICFDVKRAEIVCLLGHSGCGKTTLLRTICAFEAYESGYISIDGIKHTSPSKDIIMLFQDFNQLLPWRTVSGNIVHPLLATKMSVNRNEARDCAHQFIYDVGLDGFEYAYPHQLSGGMKQRAAVARALSLRPRVLLMDEPFAALDGITRGTLQILTRNICEKYGITVLFVTHSVEEAVIMADRIIIMDKNPGRIKEIIKNPHKNTSTAKQRDLSAANIIELLGT